MDIAGVDGGPAPPRCGKRQVQCILAHHTDPVSYTHLDVYKRQALSGRFPYPLFPDRFSQLPDSPRSDSKGHNTALVPVSYTHLDVYKRQV